MVRKLAASILRRLALFVARRPGDSQRPYQMRRSCNARGIYLARPQPSR